MKQCKNCGSTNIDTFYDKIECPQDNGLICQLHFMGDCMCNGTYHFVQVEICENCGDHREFYVSEKCYNKNVLSMEFV
jgi:hypothetical protein